MREVKKSDIELVINGLEEFLKIISEKRVFTFEELVNFMEPKFAEAGYREKYSFTNPPGQTEILILHDVGAGDFILQSAAIREIRRIYPAARITLVVSQQAFQLAEFCPYVDEVILNEQNCVYADFLEVYQWNLNPARKLLERRFDICFSFTHTLITATLMYMCGAKTRVAHLFASQEEQWNYFSDAPLSLAISRLATHAYPLYFYGSHVVDACLAFVDHTLSAPVTNREIEVWFSPFDRGAARRTVQDFSRPVYALCPGSFGRIKHYPPEKYAKVLEMILAEEPTATFVLIGGGQQDLNSAEILKNSAPEIFEKHVQNFIGKLNMRQSAAILNFCDAYIGNDTGNMHAAAALKCPVLVIFPFPADLPKKPTDGLRAFRPYKVPSVVVQPAHALGECKINEPYITHGCRAYNFPHCIATIEPEKVFEGFKILKEQIRANASEPIYIH